ncbi:MAG TPA: type II CAAX endopeptidase family protein [Candidatus Angelobacter sp.]
MEIQPPSSDPQPDPIQEIFFNQRGLRPGWRVLIAVAFYVALNAGWTVLSRNFPGQGFQGLSPAVLIPGEAVQFLLVVLVTWIMSRIEHRNMGEYGLPLKSSRLLPLFARGAILWGFLPLSLLLLFFRTLHVFYFGTLVLHGGQVWYFAGMWGVFFTVVGLTEEYSVRGYLLYTLAEGIGFWPAATVLAALFGVLHTFNRGETRIGIIMTAFFAMFAAVTLRYLGNLWLAVGAHAGWDWGQSYFYGVNDSGIQVPGHLLNPRIQGPNWLNGGSVGPEGSILTLALLVVMSILFVLFYKRSLEPVLVITRNF